MLQLEVSSVKPSECVYVSREVDCDVLGSWGDIPSAIVATLTPTQSLCLAEFVDISLFG